MYIVEGNIGAGKSTFLKVMSQLLPQAKVELEPLASWDSREHGGSLLENFIQDSHRWSYTMETFAMMCRVREHVYHQERNEPQLLLERSIYSGHYVFSLNGYRQGFMTHQEWIIYLHYFNYLIPTMCRAPRGFIYLKTDPEIAFARIQKRARESEKMITQEYLQQLHDRHEEFLIQKHGLVGDMRSVPVLVLDCNKEFENDEHHARHLSEQVLAFIMGKK
jgi:deoxyadenosine/deoxycytidine kinase